MKIAIYGNYTWNYLASSYQRAFKESGVTVTPIDTRESPQYLSNWLKNRFIHRLTIRNLSLRNLGARRWNQHVLEIVLDGAPDFFLVFNGEFLMPGTLQVIREKNIPVFIFHADNPFPEYSNYRPETLSCALESDCYFIWSKKLQKRLQDYGVQRVEYLPFAWDSLVFPYAPDISSPKYDVVFIGGWDTFREQWLEEIAQHFNVRIWGPTYWMHRTKSRSKLRSIWEDTKIGVEAATILRNSYISLNILRKQNLPDGTNMRTFEVPGCGGFSLSTRTIGSQEIFPEPQMGAYFESIDEVLNKIDYFLSHETERNAITQAAHRITEEGHQYTHRAQQILSVYRELR